LSSSSSIKKTNPDKKLHLQSQSKKHFKVQDIQSSSFLPPPPLLQFQHQQKKQDIKKDLTEKKIEYDTSLKYIKKNLDDFINNSWIKYPLSNIEKTIDNFRQTTELIREIFFNSLNLQKDFINILQPKCINGMKINIDNYVAFQEKIINLNNQMYKNNIKNIYGIKKNLEEKEKGKRILTKK
jgi:hypothetical protein